MQTTLKHPVAYKAISKITKAVHYWPTLPSYVDSNSWDIVPLYTTPPASPKDEAPQRKPLTDEQREEIAKGWQGRNWTVGDIIDAIEATHGIKE